jgi:gluconate 2-dehydrogenase gamma chain
MNRRETLAGLGALAGAALLPSTVLAEFLRDAAAVGDAGGAWTPKFFTPAQAKLLPELVEVIIPATDTPGAKSALVHVFVDLYVRDCYPKAQQELFVKGLDALDGVARARFGRPFLELAPADRLGLLVEEERASLGRSETPDKSFVRMLKHLTLLGYFSSRPGATQAAQYEHAPGPFEGCIPLTPGTKVHAL